MTLRIRLAVAFALLAAAVAGAVAVVAYSSTERRLYDETDESLLDAATRMASPDGRFLLFACVGGSLDGDGGGDGDGGDGDGGFDPDGDGRVRGFPGRPPGFPGVEVQCLGPDGAPVTSGTQTTIPVSSAAGAVATGARDRAGPETIGRGPAYRILTVASSTSPSVTAVQLARDTAETTRVLRSLRWRFLWLALAAAVLAALVGVALATRIARPLTRLTTTAEAVARSGRLDLELDAGGTGRVRRGSDEITRLAASFATMLGVLRRSKEQQQQLVQDAGHELRTPLTSLRANVDTLARYPDLDPRQREQVLADLQSELRELTDLTNEIVALAIDPADDEPVERIALDEVVAECVARARRRTGRLIDLVETPTMIDGRPRQLARAVDNLLDNAAKFSPEGTPIAVDVADATVVVRDRGPGVDARDLPHLFERFYRAPTARSAPGSGLGLAIVRDVAERHGGDVTARNHPDGGAEFTLRVGGGW